MAQRNEVPYRLLSTVDTVLPRSFYDHPKRRKTALGPMLILAAIAYAAAGVTFVVLAVQASQNTTVETVIQDHDISGSDGYTCRMISRVSSTTVGTVASEPSNSSSLVNVMESKSQCEANLKTAQPCSSPPTYIAGNSAKISFDETEFVNLALFGDYALFLDDNWNLNSYDYTRGTQRYVGNAGYSSATSSMAVDAHGILYIISDFGTGQGSSIVALNASFQVTSEDDTNTGHQIASFPTRLSGITNDNVYNLYVFDNKTVYSLSNTGVIVPIFTVADFTDADVSLGPQVDPAGLYTINTTSIYSAAVYYDQGTQSTVIYYASSGAGAFSELYMYKFSTGTYALTLLLTTINIVAPIVAGAIDSVYFSRYSALYMLNSSSENPYNNLVFTNIDMALGDRYRGLAVSVDGSRLLTTSSNDQNGFSITTGVYMAYPPYRIQTVRTQSFFAGAWFTCGDKLVSQVPQSTPSYGAKCANNGFVEQVLYQSQYAFTEEDAIRYITKNAPAHCTFDWACAALADLPPYSCSRTIRPSFFEYIGTAYANTALLMTIMLFLFALILTRLAKIYPPEGTNVHTPEVEMELSVMDNPMRSEP